jgi:hypothetical protein
MFSPWYGLPRRANNFIEPRSTDKPETNAIAMDDSSRIAVYLYAGDQIIENVTTGYLYFQDSLKGEKGSELSIDTENKKRK